MHRLSVLSHGRLEEGPLFSPPCEGGPDTKVVFAFQHLLHVQGLESVLLSS